MVKLQAIFAVLILLLIPFGLQFLISGIFGFKYYHPFQSEIAGYFYNFELTHSSLPIYSRILFILLGPILLSSILVMRYNLFRKIFLFGLPSLGIVFLLISFYAFITCYSFDCIAGVFSSYILGYLISIYIVLLPLILEFNKKIPEISIKNIYKLGVVLMIGFGICWSIYSFPRSQQDVAISKTTKDIINKTHYYNPTYLSPGVGRKFMEQGTGTAFYPYIDTGVIVHYNCKDMGSSNTFTIAQGPLNEQTKYRTLSDVEQYMLKISADTSKFSKPERIILNIGDGVYQQFQWTGNNSYYGAKLVIDTKETRIAMELVERCNGTAAGLKEEAIKIANSLQPPSN